MREYSKKLENIKKSCISHKEARHQRKLEVIKKLGGKCVRCGFSDIRALQIDHINGNGRKELMSFKSHRDALIRNILQLSANEMNTKYQLLCANCNWIKRFENNEHTGNNGNIAKYVQQPSQ